MLPWRRHKFELASGADGGRRAEDPGPSSSPPPPPSPSPPPSFPCRLRRVGRLLRGSRRRGRRRRRQTLVVSGEAPSFPALYLGHAATLQAKGEGCTEAAVARIWARSEAGRLGTRVRMTIGTQGILLAPASAASPAGASPASPAPHLYLLRRVTYGAADARLPRLFAWVYRHEGKHKAVLLRCHAAMAPQPPQAQAMALALLQASAAALHDLRRRKKRDDARRQRLLQLRRGPALPPLPGEGGRGGGGQGGHGGGHKTPAPAPAVGSSRSGPRLGAIAEDPLGEEREARQHHEEDALEDEEDGLSPRLGRLVLGLGALGLGKDQGGQGEGKGKGRGQDGDRGTPAKPPPDTG